MNKNLILEAVIAEDINLNGEGLDPKVLQEALNQTEFSAPLDGAALLLQLAAEGLV